MNDQLKQFSRAPILFILLFSIAQVFGQSLDLVPTVIEGDKGYNFQVDELAKLNSLDPESEIQPHYTTMLFLSSGHYQIIDDVPDGDVMLSFQTLGKEMGDQTSLSTTMIYSDRYNNPPPPLAPINKSVSPAIINSATDFGSFANRTSEINDVLIESNHDLLANRPNGYAVSYRPVAGGNLYIFYNRKNTEAGAVKTNTLVYDGFEQPTQPYYLNGSPNNQQMSPGNQIASFNVDGEFNSVIKYHLKNEVQLGRDDIESRLFFRLGNQELNESKDTFEMLAVLTSFSSSAEAPSDATVPGFDIVNESTSSFNINGETVVGFYLLKQATLLPNDPNSLTRIASCLCSEKLDSSKIIHMTYKFIFCNKADTLDPIEIAPATEATITIEDLWNRFQDCYTLVSSSPVPAAPQDDGSFFMEGMNLKDLNLTLDTAESCAELIFKAYTEPDIVLTNHIPLQACATFVDGEEPVCAFHSNEAGGIPCSDACTFCSPPCPIPPIAFPIFILVIAVFAYFFYKRK